MSDGLRYNVIPAHMVEGGGTCSDILTLLTVQKHLESCTTANSKILTYSSSDLLRHTVAAARLQAAAGGK